MLVVSQAQQGNAQHQVFGEIERALGFLPQPTCGFVFRFRKPGQINEGQGELLGFHHNLHRVVIDRNEIGPECFVTVDDGFKRISQSFWIDLSSQA